MTSRGAFELRVLTPAGAPERVRRSAEIRSSAHGSRELWFEIRGADASTVNERADPFVLPALLRAMDLGCDLSVRGAPVDARFLRNLAEFQRIWSAWFGFERVAVEAETLESTPSSALGIVAFSGGVDSAFSAWWHTRGDARRERRIAAAMMVRGIDIPITDPAAFESAGARSRRMAESVGLEFLTVTTNAWILPPAVRSFTGPGVISALHLLAGQFGAGLVPSTATYRDLVVPLNSSPVSDPLLGSSGFEIAHDGAYYSRFEKLTFLVQWPEAMDSLRVCLVHPRHDRNCGVCDKCMLTLAELRVIGVEPACFERSPTADELVAWARRLPRRGIFLSEAAVIVREAAERDVVEPWVRALARRIRTENLKQGVLAAWPALADTRARVARRFRQT